MITTRLGVCSLVSMFAIAWATGCAHRVAADATGRWELRGAIVDVTADRVSVRHKTGQLVDLVLDDRTVVMRDERPEGRDALRRGRRVRVDVEPLPAGGARARTVRVYGGG